MSQRVNSTLSWAEKGQRFMQNQAVATNKAIREDLECRRQLGVPFKMPEVEKATGYSLGSISTYGKVYVRELADQLLAEAIHTDQAYEAWMRDFNTFRYALQNTRRFREVTNRHIRLTIEHLHRQGESVNYSTVFRLTGRNGKAINAQIKLWAEETGNEPQKAHVWKPITLDMVRANVDQRLHQLPLTFLEDPSLGRAFNDTQLRMIYNIRQDNLRNTAFFVMTFADGNRRNDITFFSAMAKYLNEMGIPDIERLEPGAFYEKFHNGTFIPNETTAGRCRFLQTYFRLLRKQEDYVRKLTSEQHTEIEPFKLKRLQDDHFWNHSTLHGEVREDQKNRRKAATAVIHDKFYLLRDIAERRRIQIERMKNAFAAAMQRHKNTREPLPMSFSIIDETVSGSGNTRRVRHHFKLWNSQTLRALHEPVAHEDYYSYRDTQPGHPSRGQGTYFLTYDGGHAEDDPRCEQSYWFMELIDAKAFHYSPDPGFLASLGYPKSAFHVPAKGNWDVATRYWLELLEKDLSLTFLPVDTLMASALFGHAAIQIMTKTGARANEFLQIRLTRAHLIRALLPNDTEVIAFHAIPKGRKSEEPYYIDERCMKALHAWWTYQKGNGQHFDTVVPTKNLQSKLKPAPYLWQMNGKHLDHRQLNAAVCLLLHGILLRTATGENVRLTSHLLRHGFATEMRALDIPIDVLALLLKQRDVDVTDYYSRPTPAMLVELQRRIFETRVDLTRTHRRSPPHIQSQIEAAREKIGALAPVIGGTCTVANACPAAYACLGCFGNAPEPQKRSQVLNYKAHYAGMAATAEAQNLPHERRKALEIVANCEDVLAEMDLIEAADRAAQAPVNISITENSCVAKAQKHNSY